MSEFEVRILDSRLREWGFPSRGSASAAGLDLFACLKNQLTVAANQPAVLVPTGFSIWLRRNDLCGLVIPRSGQGHNNGLILGNGTGLLDPDYQGEIFVSVWNRKPRSTLIVSPGDRIAQLLVVKVEHPFPMREVSEFSYRTARGRSGFGSSGI